MKLNRRYRFVLPNCGWVYSAVGKNDDDYDDGGRGGGGCIVVDVAV